MDCLCGRRAEPLPMGLTPLLEGEVGVARRGEAMMDVLVGVGIGVGCVGMSVVCQNSFTGGGGEGSFLA